MIRFLPQGFVQSATECLSKSSPLESSLFVATGSASIILLFMSVLFIGIRKKKKGFGVSAICIIASIVLLFASYGILCISCGN